MSPSGNGEQPRLLANGMPATRRKTPVKTGRSQHFQRHLASEPLKLGRLLRMPPAPANHHALGRDLAVADQVLADNVDIIELPFLDREQSGVSDTARLEAAEFRTPQRHRG